MAQCRNQLRHRAPLSLGLTKPRGSYGWRKVTKRREDVWKSSGRLLFQTTRHAWNSVHLSEGQNKRTARTSFTASAPANEVRTCTSPPKSTEKHTLTLFLFLPLLIFPILSSRIREWSIWVYLLSHTTHDSWHGEITYH